MSNPSATAIAIRDEVETNINDYIRDLSDIRAEIIHLKCHVTRKFPDGSTVMHIATGNTYRITAGPDRLFIEEVCIPAYSYVGADNRIWVRPQREMEDGRFALVEDVE